MTHEPNTEHVLALAAIIREVNGGQHLWHVEWHVALAEAILAHPDSQWGPALPVPTDAEIEADFRAWFKTRYGTDYFGGTLCDVVGWGKHLLQHSPQPAAPWPQLSREVPPEVLNRAMRICKADAVKVVWQAACDQLENLKPSPQSVEDQDRQRAAAIAEAAWQWKRHKETRDREGKGAAPTPVPTPWPELPRRPPASAWHDENLAQHSGEWIEGVSDGWCAARVELQRLGKQVGVAPTPAPAAEPTIDPDKHERQLTSEALNTGSVNEIFWPRSNAGGEPVAPAPALPEISDQLIKMLIGDVLAVSGTATEQACLNRCWNPVPEVRARLREILRLAAQDEAKRPAS
jgi:hypothetical protein